MPRSSKNMFPDYLKVPADQLGAGTNVKVTIKGPARVTVSSKENHISYKMDSMAGIADAVANDMLAEILRAETEGHHATLIVPVGPVDQYPILAETINRQKISLRDVVFINMDEYLTDDDQWVPAEHPLSFRGYMDRLFYNLLDPMLAPKPENRVFPHPQKCDEIQRLIESRGGVDATFGGIGINGHMAFNEPPERDETISNEEFAKLPTRVLSLTRETRTINSVTVGGEISIIPWRCVTVGMKEILESRRMRFYCNRPWQSAVARRVLHGPVTAACPASFMRTHPEAYLTVAEYVAQPPNIQLR